MSNDSAARRHVTIRLSTAGLEAIDEIAKAEDRPRSWVIRKLLSEALAARTKR